MRTDTSKTSRVAYYCFVLFMAGGSFLVFEVGWQRLLALVLGSTVIASTLVLSAYMAGFGLGARLWSSLKSGARRPCVTAGWLLLGVGLTGVLNLLLFTSAMPALLARGLPTWVLFALATLLLIAQALPMGGLFPLVSGLAAPTLEGRERTLGRLYAFESLGSALGALLTAFLLLGLLGQCVSILVAVGVDLLLALLFFLHRGGRVTRSDEAQAETSVPEYRVSREARGAAVVAFLCGFVMLALQALWMRAFHVYFTNTSYTFALIAAIVVLGLFIGSLAFSLRRGAVSQRASVTRGSSSLSLADCRWPLAGLSLFTLLGSWLLFRLPQTLMLPLQETLANPLLRVFLFPGAVALLIVLPPALCSGYLFPLACTLAARAGRTTSAVGRVLSANTLGAVLGPLLGTFLLLPFLGVTRGLLLVGLLPAGVGFWLTTRNPGAELLQRVVLGTAIVVPLLIVIAAPALPVLPPSFALNGRELLYHRETLEGTLSVGLDHPPLGNRRHTFVNNSQVIGATYDAVKVVKMVGHLPFLLGHECRDVLVIGFGIGVTTSAIASHDEVRSIECVELLPGLQEAAAYYEDLNRGVARDPRLHLYGGDGRQYLAASRKRYDLISCDPTHPILGSASLYTREYFESCQDHLSEHGLVSQYLPLHKLGHDEFMGIVATFAQVFPQSTLWLGHYHAILLGARDTLGVDFTQWQKRVDALIPDEYFYQDAYHLAACLILDSEAMQQLAMQYPANCEDRSYTEFFALDCLREENLPDNLTTLDSLRVSPAGLFAGIPDMAMMERYLSGNRALCRSLAHHFRGENAAALEELHQACEVNPESQEYPFLIRLGF